MSFVLALFACGGSGCNQVSKPFSCITHVPMPHQCQKSRGNAVNSGQTVLFLNCLWCEAAPPDVNQRCADSLHWHCIVATSGTVGSGTGCCNSNKKNPGKSKPLVLRKTAAMWVTLCYQINFIWRKRLKGRQEVFVLSGWVWYQTPGLDPDPRVVAGSGTTSYLVQTWKIWISY